MKTFTHKLFTLLLPAVLGCTRSYAQTDTSNLANLSLKELLNVKVITASKTMLELGLTPASVTVVTKEQVKLRGYQSLLDVLNDLPDVKVDDKIYSGIRNSITIRGTQGSEKLVILLDGITISTPSGEALPIMENYPVNLAEQIEIVFGPASALYGANAVSGVINIITKKETKKGFHIEASSLAGTYGYTNTSLFLTQKISDRVKLVLSGQYFYDKQPDYSKLYNNDSFYNITSHKTGVFNTIYGPAAPEQPIRTKYEAPMQAYNLYAALYVNGFTFSYFRNYTRLPTAWGNNTNNAIYNKEVFMAQSVSTINAAHKKTWENLTAASMLTVSEYGLDPKSNYRNLYSAMEPAYKYSVCSMIKAEEMLHYKASEKFAVTAGASYENYYSIPQSADLKAPVDKNRNIAGTYLGTETYYRPQGLAAQFYFIRYQNIGTYTQLQYSPNAKLHITAGSRYDVSSRYGSSFNPRLGIVYKPANRTTIKLLYGSAFLAPSPSDCYIQYGSFDTQDSGKTYHSYFLHLPNPGLKPILSRNAEISIQHYLTENTSITLDMYYTSLTGLHAFADDNTSSRLYNNQFNGIPVDYIQVFINQDKQHNYGGSLVLNQKYSFGAMEVNSYASVSMVDGVLKHGDNGSMKNAELDFISPFMLRVGADIKWGKFSCSPRLQVMGTQRLPGISTTNGSTSKRQTLNGYSLLSFSARYAIKKGIHGFVNVSNALNSNYKAVGFNMDLTKTDTELFYGQRQDPVRVMAGFAVNF